MPREWADKESRIRELVRAHVSRGSVTVAIRRDEVRSERSVCANIEQARAYVDALQRIQDELGLPGAVTIEHLSRFPDVFTPPAQEKDDEETWNQLQAGLLEALEALNTMRDREGAELANDLTARMNLIEQGLATIEVSSAERLIQERTRLRERVAQILGDVQIDEQRIAMEIVLLSDKLDITEECVRLRSHIKHVRQYMISNEHAGRKLNFMLQEMNREVNTIGSKSNHADIAVIVVSMKEELERMREQVQNVE
jgi:uncharacterized protein (TIGR00255 family)